jgi:cytidyltransferase-like protein
MNDKIILVTGGFDPLHSGHIEYIKAARELGRVVVGVNSDEWLIRKKGQPFMPFSERLNIVNNLKDVMTAIGFDDSDGSAKDAIKKVRQMFPNNTIVFANGGDRTKENIPEMNTDVNNVEFLFGVGGENKMNSSSWILQEWKTPKTERQWGYYRVLHTDKDHIKVKELTVKPHSKLSLQRHFKRSEYWMVAEGRADLLIGTTKENCELIHLDQFQDIRIPVNTWHQLINNTNSDLKIVEIQYGNTCIEEDIERS